MEDIIDFQNRVQSSIETELENAYTMPEFDQNLYVVGFNIGSALASAFANAIEGELDAEFVDKIVESLSEGMRLKFDFLKQRPD